MEWMLVTPIAGDLTGKIYRVMSHGLTQCKIRDITIKPVRSKDNFFMLTDNLVQVHQDV